MKQSGILNNISIEENLSVLQKELDRVGVTGDDKLRLMLSIEEILLGYQGHFGNDTTFTLLIKKKGGKIVAELTVPGERCDLLGDPDSLILIKVLHNWSNAPVWDHSNGTNRITYSIKLRNSLKDNLKFAWIYTKPNKKFQSCL